MKSIFDNPNFGEFKLNSRIVRTGLWESQDELQKNLSADIFLRYETLAKNNVGLITTELISMYTHDRFSDYTHYINSPNFVREFKEVTSIVNQYNVPIFAQVGFVNCNVNGKQMLEVNDLTIEDIRKIQADYIMTAKKVAFAGFDGIQLSIGNNYYLSRIMNPFENQRTDDYGGNTLNRIRIVLEIIKLIKKTIGFHVSCRINIEDVRKGGLTQDESMKMAKLLAENGADSIQITGRTISMKYDAAEKHVFQDYADKLSQEVDIPVILAGNLRDMKTMNNILNNSSVEFMSLSKPFVAQADFLADWKKNGDGTSRCKGCNNCYSKKESRCFQYND